MAVQDEFSDRALIETIRRALWQPRGRAAVMVGAGFSRNAQRIYPSTPNFPLWNDLAEKMHRELHPGVQHSFSGDPLRLASIYESTFGRNELDNLLLKSIADNEYEPVDLHARLLSLPWTDVFTTNYDTLLERAERLSTIKYDVVTSPSDLSVTGRPRIVKLHGTFPSQRPFIITAEDYRRYPVDFAPLVNMVQQSIMENVFCLIGFSGEDPNFLQWAGWVRDNLQQAAPKIYLCGVLDLDSSRQRAYESLRVTPIDLGPIFPVNQFGRVERHACALGWFIESLANGQPINRSEWPSSGAPALPRSDHGGTPPPLPPVEAAPIIRKPTVSYTSKGDLNIDDQTCTQVIESWRSQRQAYPGWIVCPERNRITLWHESKEWVFGWCARHMECYLRKLPLPEMAAALRELLWVLRRCLVPLPDWALPFVEEILRLINPFPAKIALENAVMVAGRDSAVAGKPIDWPSMEEAWIACAFELLNDAWQEQNDKQFHRAVELLGGPATLNPEWQARWHFEQCWFHLLRGDESAAREILRRWPERKDLPFWEVKRAAILAELGDVQGAAQRAQAVLNKIRRPQNAQTWDYETRSLEGWLIYFLRPLERLKLWGPGIADQDSFGKINRDWEDHRRFLARYRCNPSEDMDERAERITRHELEAIQPDQDEFDPDRSSRSVRFHSPNYLDWGLLQSFHDAPVPMRSGHLTFVNKQLWNFAHANWDEIPKLVLALILRCGATSHFKKYGRHEIATLDHASANEAYKWAARALRQAMSSPASAKKPDSMSARMLSVCPEIISRLSIRLSAENLEDMHCLAIEMYKSEDYRFQPPLHGQVNTIFRRLLFAASGEQLLGWVGSLLSLPIPGVGGFSVASDSMWPEPFQMIEMRKKFRDPTPQERADWQTHVPQLLHLARAVESDTRVHAASRLYALVELGGVLDNEQIVKFEDALWSRLDADGMPQPCGLTPAGFLHVVGGGTRDVKDLIRQAFLKRPIPSVKRGEEGELSSETIRNVSTYLWELRGASAGKRTRSRPEGSLIDWSIEESEALLLKVKNWFDESGEALTSIIQRGPTDWLYDSAQRIVHGSLALIAEVIAPRQIGSEGRTRRVISGLLEKIDSLTGPSPTASVVQCLFREGSDRLESATNLVINHMHSSSSEEVLGACCGLYYWLGLEDANLLPGPPALLLDSLMEMALGRRQPGLTHYVQLLTLLVREYPSKITEARFDQICKALDFLAEDTRLRREPFTAAQSELLRFPPEERGRLRQRASELASTVATHCREQGIEIPKIIQSWEQDAVQDPLPEVRHAWEISDDLD